MRSIITPCECVFSLSITGDLSVHKLPWGATAPQCTLWCSRPTNSGGDSAWFSNDLCTLQWLCWWCWLLNLCSWAWPLHSVYVQLDNYDVSLFYYGNHHRSDVGGLRMQQAISSDDPATHLSFSEWSHDCAPLSLVSIEAYTLPGKIRHIHSQKVQERGWSLNEIVTSRCL